MDKFKSLKEMVEENGTEKMKQMVRLTEKHYIDGLDGLLRDRPVSKVALNTYFIMWRKDIEADAEIQSMDHYGVMMLFLNIFFILRHTWELEDENGITKTGDDLHEAYPELFEGDEMLSLEQVYERISTF